MLTGSGNLDTAGGSSLGGGGVGSAGKTIIGGNVTDALLSSTAGASVDGSTAAPTYGNPFLFGDYEGTRTPYLPIYGSNNGSSQLGAAGSGYLFSQADNSFFAMPGKTDSTIGAIFRTNVGPDFMPGLGYEFPGHDFLFVINYGEVAFTDIAVGVGGTFDQLHLLEFNAAIREFPFYGVGAVANTGLEADDVYVMLIPDDAASISLSGNTSLGQIDRLYQVSLANGDFRELTIPEPTSAVWLTVCGLCVLGRRARRHSIQNRHHLRGSARRG